MVGGESREMVAVGAEADMTVGPDDEQRQLADAQLVGCGWRKPCPTVRIVGLRRERDRRFDECAVAAIPDRFGEACEIVGARR